MAGARSFHRTTQMPSRFAAAMLAAALMLAPASRAAAQTAAVHDTATATTPPSATPAAAPAPAPAAAPRPARHGYWTPFALGFVSSILAHEAGHIGTAIALGKHPTFGFDKGRPTVYSGINSYAEPHEQFLFSSMGLTVQSVIDEAILDVPHRRGAPFERGMLAGGIATTLFYVTIGRSGSVSDVDFMSRTSSLSKTQISLIYGSIAALHAFRISRDGHYANFFARPQREGGMRVGVRIE